MRAPVFGSNRSVLPESMSQTHRLVGTMNRSLYPTCRSTTWPVLGSIRYIPPRSEKRPHQRYPAPTPNADAEVSRDANTVDFIGEGSTFTSRTDALEQTTQTAPSPMPRDRKSVV